MKLTSDTALSDLGHRAYTHYWSQTLSRTILSLPPSKTRTITILDLRDETYIVPEDIIATLQSMEVLETRKKGGKTEVVINREKVRRWVESKGLARGGLKGVKGGGLENPVDPGGFLGSGSEVEV